MRELPNKFLAAMIAVKALPGAPLYKGDNNAIIDSALKDLEEYKKVGVDSIILENDHDLPYIKPPLPKEAINLMLEISKKVRKDFSGPIGIQMLEAANEDSLFIAKEADLDYIRVEGYVFAHVGTNGIIEGCAGRLKRYQKEIGAEHIKIFTDIKKKHCSHALTMDLDITDEAKQAEFCLIDGFIVTSQFTGIAPKADDLVKVKQVSKLPVLIGSGMDKDNIGDYFSKADGFIVGSTFRKDGKFMEEIDSKRLKDFMVEFNKFKKS